MAISFSNSTDIINFDYVNSLSSFTLTFNISRTTNSAVRTLFRFKNELEEDIIILRYLTSNNTFELNVKGNVINGVWRFGILPSNTNSCLSLTFDGGATTPVPVAYQDGVLLSITTLANVISRISDGNVIEYGSSSADSSVFAGNIAEIGVYSNSFSSDVIKSLSIGYSPINFQNNLISYLPLIRDVYDLKGNSLTVSGGTVANHPRVIYPRGKQLNTIFGASGGGSQVVQRRYDILEPRTIMV